MSRDPDDVVRAYAGPLVLVEVYQAALTAAGIECRVVGTELAAGLGSVLPESIELWVHRADLSRAEGVIAAEAGPKTARHRDRPHHNFPHPTNDPKPGPPPFRAEPYVNPDPGA